MVGDEGDQVGPQVRASLKAIGVKAGRFGLFVPALLKPRSAAMRARLWSVHHGVAAPVLPAPDLVSLPRQPQWPSGFAESMGWLEAGPVLLRLDIAERVAAELAWATRRGAAAMPAALASRFSLKADLLPVVLRRLGFRVLPAGVASSDEFGPPAPAMLLPLRRRRAVAEPAAAVHAQHPFAALAALKR
jgi:ATP-dependent RNA helicase SUPV3L1/SUV3